MYILEFETARTAISAVAANCHAELMKNVQGIEEWIRSLEYVDNSEEQPIFPKTPTAARKTRKRPMVATILEDEEVADWAVDAESPVKRVRGSRAASKNASSKMKEMNQNLNKKLRRPTDFDKRPDTSMVEAVAPPKRQRRNQDSVASAASSLGTSFSSARSTQSVAIVPCEMSSPPNVIDVEDDVDENRSTASRAFVVASSAKPSGGDASSSEDEDVFLAELARMKKLRKSSRRSSHTTVSETTVTVTTTTVSRLTTTRTPTVVVSVPTVEEVESSEEESLPLRAVMMNVPPHLSPVVKLTTMSPAQVDNACRRQPQTPVSVKRRVAAYEREVLAVEQPVGRMTRTKTKAMASSGSAVNLPHVVQKADMSLLQKLARKSVCKAIRITKDKDRKVQEADKENSFVGQPAKPVAALLTAAKVRNTPFSNSKPQRMVLTSASTNRITVNQCTSRTTFVQDKSTCSNVLSGLDSFISKPKVVSAEEVEEKRRDERKRREEKEEEAVRKKKEMMERKIEAQKRKREEKMQKVMASREAIEREKAEQQVRAEREKVEKLRQAQEREERQREEMQRKKQQAQQKAAEIEERRRLEEAQRLQRIKEQEEEQRRLAAARKKEMEEVERQALRRQQEEAEMERERAVKAALEAKEKQRAALEAKEKQRAALEKQQKAALEAKKQQGKPPAAAAPLDGTFVVPGTGRPPLRVASVEDCELLDLSAGDSESEDERGTVPRWADHKRLKARVKELAYVSLNYYSAYFGSHPTTPNLCEVFGNPKLRAHKRTSSAIWKTMPRYSLMPKDL